SSGTTGTIAPPIFDIIIVYAGSLVVHPIAEPHVVRWCVTNDVTTWLGVSAQACGQGKGGPVNAIADVGISGSGISPFSALFVGKSKQGVYAYKGALGTLEESTIQIQAGVLDSDSVKFINGGPDLGAGICFLGTDRKYWWTNGIAFAELSWKIATELSNE